MNEDCIELAHAELARRSFADYLTYVYPPMLYSHAAHTRLIAGKLQQIEEGALKRLMVFLPPRHSKSMTISESFPSWYLGRNPDKQVILASYGASLASQFGRSNRRLVTEFGASLFGVDVAEDAKGKEAWAIADRRGFMTSVSIGGSVTGKGADLLIIDDPIKNAEEANSQTIRSKVAQEYQATLRTRLHPNGAVILILTRWHQEDLAGWLLGQEEKGGEKWEVVSLPAFAEANDPLGRAPGDILWPERFSKEDYQEARSSLGSYFFSALYQQSPLPAEGNRFKRSWFAYYTEDETYYYLHTGRESITVEKDRCWSFITVDTAATSGLNSDYTVAGHFVAAPGGWLLVEDIVRERLTVPEQERLLHALCMDKKPSFIAVETNNTGIALTQYLNAGGLPVKELRADKDKISRANAVLIMYENRRVFHKQGAPWTDVLQDELTAFPSGKHDDQADVLAYAGMLYNQYAVFNRDTFYVSAASR